MKIPLLLACLFAMSCDARLTGIDHEIYPAVVWQLADGTYLVRLETDVDETHDFICEHLRHSMNCQCTQSHQTHTQSTK